MGYEDSDSDNDDLLMKKANASKATKTSTIKVDVSSLVAQNILKDKVTAGPEKTKVCKVDRKLEMSKKLISRKDWKLFN